MSTRRQNPRSPLYLGIGFVLLIAAVTATVWLFQMRRASTDWVEHTLKVGNGLSLALSTLQDAETGERGYLLTGDPAFLQPYAHANQRLADAVADLSRLMGDNPRQVQNLARLREKAAGLFELQRRSIEARGQADTGSLMTDVAQSKALMDGLRQTISRMRQEEERLLAERQARAARLGTLVNLGLAASLLGAIALAAFALVDSRRRIAELMSARDDLAAHVDMLRAEAASREAAESQVRQLQKMEAIGQLTGGIAHDFNNMLAIVLGSLEMGVRRLDEDRPRAIAFINNAIDGAQRAAQLTSRLLAFSRQQPLEPQPMDCNTLVAGMSEMLRRTIGEIVQVETVLAGGLWRAHVDPGQLENAIINLCVNARDAMPDGGKLTIETSNGHLDDAYAAENAEVAPGQYVVVAISDTGTGMPREVVDRAFDPFYTTKGVGRGTGLGLSQVYGFIKQSRGHAKIYSEPGHGTTVKLYIPRFFGAETNVRRPEQPELAAVRAKDGETILVVEDEASVRHVSVETLREFGYVVVQAGDAGHALAMLEVQPRVDLLLTDIVMPDMNGRRLAEIAQSRRPDLKVIYTTGYTRNAVIHNGMLDPGVAFIAKPFTSQQLAAKVRQVLDGGGVNRPLPEDAS